MALRLIEAYHREPRTGEIETLLEGHPVVSVWHDRLPDGLTLTKILMKTEETEPVLDELQKRFEGSDLFRAVLLPVEATLPRPEEPEEEEAPEKKSPERISIEELYQDLLEDSGVSRKYVVMAVLAAFVAGLGLIRNDAAVIIGSMVIAPPCSDPTWHCRWRPRWPTSGSPGAPRSPYS